MKYVLKLAYDGSQYFGFQRQSKDKTVQGELEKALSRVFDQTIEISGAGRTDTGVHAFGQVVSFESEKERPLQGLLKGVNGMLAPGAALLEGAVLPGESDFHPRFSALSRTYEYHILASCEQKDLVINSQRHWCLAEELDLNLMEAVCPIFVGEHDFQTFSARCEVPHHRREVKELTVERLNPTHLSRGTHFKLTITATGFLRRMVRLITAAVVEAGLGLRSPVELRRKLEARDSNEAPHPAPAQGLYFAAVSYDPSPFAREIEHAEHIMATPSRNYRYKH